MNILIFKYKKFLEKRLDRVNMGLQVIRRGPHWFTNLLNLNKKNGKLVCRNGFVLNFNETNYHNVRGLFYFSLLDGVLLSNKNKRGYWNYKNNIITTPQGIKFDIKAFDELIFAETFLHDIHFSDFNLRDKIVIQAGGFTGDTALYYANRGANVYSFEPDSNSYSVAIRNLKLNPKLNKKIVFQNLAVDKDGIIEFPVNDEGSGGSSIYNTDKNRIVKIRSVSIKTILEEFKIKNPFLLDLDIKGSEFNVINEKILSKFKIIRIEYSTKIGDKKIGSRSYIIKKLKQYGFNNIRIYKHNYGIYDLSEHGTIEAKK
jgi:FkbM family methyltransferase